MEAFAAPFGADADSRSRPRIKGFTFDKASCRVKKGSSLLIDP
jgi:hypothetical protein